MQIAKRITKKPNIQSAADHILIGLLHFSRLFLDRCREQSPAALVFEHVTVNDRSNRDDRDREKDARNTGDLLARKH